MVLSGVTFRPGKQGNTLSGDGIVHMVRGDARSGYYKDDEENARIRAGTFGDHEKVYAKCNYDDAKNGSEREAVRDKRT